MSFSLNQTEIVGTLVNCVVRTTGSGTELAEIDVSVPDSYRDKTGKMVEKKQIIRGVCWGFAKDTAKATKIGTTVLVRGALRGEFSTPRQQGGKSYHRLELSVLGVFPLAVSGAEASRPGPVPEGRPEDCPF